MDAYDYMQIDKAMSKRLQAIFGDPKRHAFYSCFDADEAEDRRGARGAIKRGPKRLCFHCLTRKNGHAEKTEQL